MARGEIYVQLYVGYGDDPKMRALARFGRQARPARDLYVQMICYCRAGLTDGFVPDEQLGILAYPDPPAVAAKDAECLAAVGLVKPVEGGWFVLAYPKRNPTRAQVAGRLTAREEAGRRANHERWHTKRGKADPACVYCSGSDPTTDPTGNPRPDPTTDPGPDPNRIGPLSEPESTETETGFGVRTRTPKGPTPDGVGEPPAPRTRGLPTAERLPVVIDSAPVTTDAIIGEWLDHCRARPAKSIIGQIGKIVKTLLAEGANPVHIRAGLDQWRLKGLHPSTLPSMVNAAANAGGPALKPSTTDQRVSGILALADQLEEAS